MKIQILMCPIDAQQEQMVLSGTAKNGVGLPASFIMVSPTYQLITLSYMCWTCVGRAATLNNRNLVRYSHT